MKNKNLWQRAQFALQGIVYAFKTEKSFKIQLLAALLSIVYFAWLDVTLIWWAVLCLFLGFILAAELFNSALELLCDHLNPEYHSNIGHIKDMAAGGILILSIAAISLAVLATWQFA